MYVLLVNMEIIIQEFAHHAMVNVLNAKEVQSLIAYPALKLATI